MTRFLVTGGSGFIGSNFLHLLLHRAEWDAACCPDHRRYLPPAPAGAPEILNVDALTYASDPSNLAGVDGAPGYSFVRADVADAAAVDAAFRQFRPEVVVHFAAETHVDRSIADGDVFVRSNVLGTQRLLDAARRHDVARFLHVSTDEVYGSAATGSFAEDAPLAPSSPYSASKAASDLLVLAHHHTYGLPVQITRCTNNYGPRQHPEKLLPKIIGRALRGERLPLYGTGRNVRDWLYVKDHAAAILRVLDEQRWGEIYNVSGADERTNLDVAHAVLGALGRPDDLVELVPDRPGHDWRYSLDDTKLRRLGWRPVTEFPLGLADTVAWVAARQRTVLVPQRGGSNPQPHARP